MFLQSKRNILEEQNFWLTFGQDRYSPCCPTATQVFQIRIVNGNIPTSVTIYFTNLNETVSFNVSANEVYTYSLTLSQKETVHNTVTGINNYSIRITSNNPISVYAYHATTATTFRDATNVLPVTALGTNYYQISYTVTNYDDAYAIVATQNNTLVHHNGVHEATLDAGEVYYRTSNADMTGTHITSNNPVAFFALHIGAAIPYGTSSYKHLMQQLAPVSTWDKVFFVPVTVVEQGTVRMVAQENNTNITVDGGNIRIGVPGAQTSLSNLQAGQFVELEITNSNGCYIQADKRVGICAYETRYTHNEFRSMPAQTWISGIEQTVVKAQIAPFTSIGLYHFALIVTPSATNNNTKVSIGGGLFADLSGGIWIDNTIADMSFYNMPLTNETASYTFTNSEGIIIFGYGVGINSFASYYYLAYSAMRDLDAVFYANDIHFQELKENTFCAGNVDFRAEIEGLHQSTGSLKWYINGSIQPDLQDLKNWNKPFTIGEYEIRMWVRFENDETAEKIGTLKVISCNHSAEFFANDIHHSELQDQTICNKTGKVDFQAVIEGLSSEMESLKWYIDDGTGEAEETTAQDQLTWNKIFTTGTYQIRMWVRYENGETENITATLKVEVFWIKIRNIRY